MNVKTKRGFYQLSHDHKEKIRESVKLNHKSRKERGVMNRTTFTGRNDVCRE
jgi:hypothetical protein